MNLQSERGALHTIAQIITKTADSLDKALRYIYAVTEHDYYNASFKDIVKLVSIDITDSSLIMLYCDIDKTDEFVKGYKDLSSLMLYSFAIRVYTLKKYESESQVLDDSQLENIYDQLVANGAKNLYNIFDYDYNSIKKLYKKKKDLPPFNALWYKKYLKENAELFEGNNLRWLTLLGAADELFTLYYVELDKALQRVIDGFEKY